MVTPEKVRRLRLAAETWLAVHPECGDCEARFDVVVVRGRALECIRRAF
jgi:Holliday junction resolvase-like predicted endonuclease